MPLLMTSHNKAVGGSRLCPWCTICYHCVQQQNQTAWHSSKYGLNLWLLAAAQLQDWYCQCYIQLLSSTKRKCILYILHCHQRRTQPRPQLTSTENFVMFGHVVFWDMQAQNRQTY